MLIGTAVLMPEMVIAIEVTFALNGAPVTAGKLNESGVVSAAMLLVELLTELSSELILELAIGLALLIGLLEELPSELLLEPVIELLLELPIGLTLAGTWLAVLPLPPPPPQAANELTRPKIKSLRIPV